MNSSMTPNTHQISHPRQPSLPNPSQLLLHEEQRENQPSQGILAREIAPSPLYVMAATNGREVTQEPGLRADQRHASVVRFHLPGPRAPQAAVPPAQVRIERLALGAQQLADFPAAQVMIDLSRDVEVEAREPDGNCFRSAPCRSAGGALSGAIIGAGGYVGALALGAVPHPSLAVCLAFDIGSAIVGCGIAQDPVFD